MKNRLLNHIQFLRGLSVLLVFFYHLKLNYFEYGFLGVDIFFVISGYVITSRIYDEFQKTKRINILNFYLKRFQRIYPVLILVMSFTLILIIFFQPLDLFLNNLNVYFFSIFGISNLYYLFSKKNYFDTVFDDPYAHTWSLGVEEQFYIIFPVFLYFILKNFRNHNVINSVLILLIIISIFFSFNFEYDRKLVFYSPFFRFWEFLIGSTIFFVSKSIKFKNNLISIFILLMLMIFIVFYKNSNLTNIIIIVTVLSSLFILSYQNNHNNISSFIIENKLFVFFGNISYSFYLWHLPLIYFYDLYFLENFFRVPILFLSTFMLSCISYIFIENKFRYLKINFNLFLKICLSSFIFIFSFLLINSLIFKDNNKIRNNIKKTIYSMNYLENKINFSERTDAMKIKINGSPIYINCSEASKSIKLNADNLNTNCLKKGKNNNRIFYIEGNSHTANFVPMFNQLNLDDTIYYNYKSGSLININYKKINELKKSYEEIIYTTNINNSKILDRLKKIQHKFDNDIKILILGTPPYITEGLKPLKCFIKNINCKFDTSKDKKDRKLADLNIKINALINDNSKFLYFDPYLSICPKDTCYVFNVDKNLITHRDESHLTVEGSIMMKNEFSSFYNLKLR